MLREVKVKGFIIVEGAHHHRTSILLLVVRKSFKKQTVCFLGGITAFLMDHTHSSVYLILMGFEKVS